MKIKTLDKIFKYLYGSVLTILLVYVIYFMTALILSPKNDLKQRGFIACTRDLVLHLGDCESGQLGCVLKAFYRDTSCNSKVIFKGFSAWFNNKQPTPWANYIFTPELQEETENPYLSNPEEDMKKMDVDHKFMMQKAQELEDIKNRSLKADENVIISDPETTDEPITVPESETQTEADFEQNIDDELDIGELNNGDKTAQKIEPLPEKKLNSGSEKIAEKAKNEVLKKGE